LKLAQVAPSPDLTAEVMLLLGRKTSQAWCFRMHPVFDPVGQALNPTVETIGLTTIGLRGSQGAAQTDGEFGQALLGSGEQAAAFAAKQFRGWLRFGFVGQPLQGDVEIP